MDAVTFLGTGPGDVMPGRFQSSILLDWGDSRILLDAGEPCSGQLLNLGNRLTDLDAVWITHAHADHVGGLPLLLQASWLHGRTEALPLGMPAHLMEPLKMWLRAVFLSSLPYPLEMFPWETASPLAFRDMSVTAHPTTHLADLGDPSLVSYLFDIRHEERRVVYSGDLGAAGDLLPLLSDPIDLLICELAHLTADELVSVLAPAKVGVLCLTHISSDLEEEARGEIKMHLERELSGVEEIYLPGDGERVDF